MHNTIKCMRDTIILMAERPTTVRLKAGMNSAVREVAAELGITFNAALSVLLAEALKARGKTITAAPVGDE